MSKGYLFVTHVFFFKVAKCYWLAMLLWIASSTDGALLSFLSFIIYKMRKTWNCQVIWYTHQRSVWRAVFRLLQIQTFLATREASSLWKNKNFHFRFTISKQNCFCTAWKHIEFSSGYADAAKRQPVTVFEFIYKTMSQAGKISAVSTSRALRNKFLFQIQLLIQVTNSICLQSKWICSLKVCGSPVSYVWYCKLHSDVCYYENTLLYNIGKKNWKFTGKKVEKVLIVKCHFTGFLCATFKVQYTKDRGR